MLEIFGKAIISFIEKELVSAAPEVEKMLMEALESLAEMLAQFLGMKAAALAAPVKDIEPVVEHE